MVHPHMITSWWLVTNSYLYPISQLISQVSIYPINMISPINIPNEYITQFHITVPINHARRRTRDRRKRSSDSRWPFLTKGSGWPLSLGRCGSLRFYGSLWRFILWNEPGTIGTCSTMLPCWLQVFIWAGLLGFFSIDWTFQGQIIQSHSSRFKMRRSTWVKSPVAIHTWLREESVATRVPFGCFQKTKALCFFLHSQNKGLTGKQDCLINLSQIPVVQTTPQCLTT